VRTLFAAVLMVLAIVAPVLGRAQEASPPATVFGAESVVWDIRLADGDLSGLPAMSVLEIDGAEATAGDVASLQAEGIVPICYINAGAWEEWRDDADAYPEEIIGSAYPGWDGERFVDIRRLDVLGPILEARLDDCAEKGFAAVDPDNVDTYDTETGFPLTEEDQLRFNRWLADAAHQRGLEIGQKNAPGLADELAGTFDFAVTEDCLVDGWCDEMEPYPSLSKPVLMVEYTDRGYSVEELCALAEGTFGAVVIKQRDLGAWSAHCD
jgi:endo-alpha-1,4-polygalactosaminidase (GH114 family)